MKINMEKLNQTVKKEIPNGFFGYFEERDGYNKLVAYGTPIKDELKFSWIHKEYQR